MNFRTTVVLLVITILGAAYLFFVDRHQPGTEESARLGKRIFTWKSDQIQRVRIHKDYWTDIICERLEDGSWQLQKPLEVPANESQVNRLLSTLEFAEYVNRLDADDELLLRLDQFGLQEPLYYITLEGNRVAQTLLIGNDSPLGDGVYALLKDRDDVLMIIPRSILNVLETDTDSWISPEREFW